MSSIAVAALVFACTFVGALVGLWLHTRLPDTHLDGDSKDTVKLVMGHIATVAALVLGLLISSAHSSYDAQDVEVQQIGIHLFQLDRALDRFGPEAKDARDMLYRFVQGEVERASKPGGTKAAIDAPMEAQQAPAALFDKISSLSPKTDTQRFAQARAVQLLTSLSDTLLLLNQQARSAISWPFLAVLMFWLTVLFIGFGLFARRNATLVAALCLGATSVAGAAFLIHEMNQPYTGVMQISIAPIRNALSQMNR